MTLPDLSALGLETSDDECHHLSRYSELVRNAATVSDSTIKALEVAEKILRDRARLITALSDARAERDTAEHAEQEAMERANIREAAARETIATLTAENAELTRRAADAYMLARQPTPEPVDTGGNDDDRSRHFPMKD